MRAWYVAPYRLGPWSSIRDGAILDMRGEVVGRASELRGGVGTAREAADLAHAWRAQGKRSRLWLVLVEDGRVTHASAYQG